MAVDAPPDLDAFVAAVCRTLTPKVSPILSDSDIEKYLSRDTPTAVSWDFETGNDIPTLQRPARWGFVVNVMCHGYSRGQAKDLAAGTWAAFKAAVGMAVGEQQIRSVRSVRTPVELRFNGQVTTHNRYMMALRVTVA